MISNEKTIELLQNISFNDVEFVGKSICTLAQFSIEKLPIPAGFVVSSLTFLNILEQSGLKSEFDFAKETNEKYDLEKNIVSLVIPGSIRNELTGNYSKISGFTDAYVNLRATILGSSSESISHRTYCKFDIRGEEELVKAISDLYKEIVLDNLDNADDFFSGDLKIVIIAQRSVQSEASGIMFTTDIVTKNTEKLVIEAVYGLESGTDMEGIIPDQYVFDKNSGEIKEKHIANQEFMIVRQMGSASPTQKVSISPAWQKRQKIDDKHIMVLGKTGQIIEEELGEAQQINWSYESGKIWINFIEGQNKKKYTSAPKQSLQNQVETLIRPTGNYGTDVNVHIPQSVVEDRNILVDLVLEETNKKEQKAETIKPIDFVREEKPKTQKMEKTNTKTNTHREALIEGVHSAGGETQGEITFNPDTASINNILVLKGDEDISSNLQISGFIIEDESAILASRLNEYFKVPVITGVALARKILKEGELILIDGATSNVYELVTESVVDLDVVTRTEEKSDKASFSFPVTRGNNLEIQAELTPTQTPQFNDDDIVPVNEIIVNSDFDEVKEIELESNSDKTTLYEDQKIKIEKRNHAPQLAIPVKSEKPERKDLSRLLDLVEEDEEVIEVEETELSSDKVEGVSENDQLKVWGKSLDNIISSSKKIAPEVAVNVLEQVIEDTNNIEQNSKEYAFDNEERYIASLVAEEPQKQIKSSPFIPTATKVYVQILDENLDKNLENFDGIVFSCTFEIEPFFNLLEDTLEKAGGKEVLVICPPYEEPALEKFFEKMHGLRNKGHRNLSAILPDYRNKKELSEFKKTLSLAGLRRSSTFSIYANLSRTINVFRISELEEDVTDGVYVDLFRLKMNMLGVDKLTASTKYVDGMKNLVSYIHENLKVNGNTLINISAFDSPKKVIQHLSNFGFWGIVCEQYQTDEIKRHISKTEKNRISLPAKYMKPSRRK
jgi:phosphoenolpyruvate synthase/pyruvate phosphate dikinase